MPASSTPLVSAASLASPSYGLPPPPPPSPLLQRFASSGLGLLTAGASSANGAVQLLTGLQLDGQLDMDDMVLGIVVSCLILAVISLLGLTVTCSRAGSCARRIASFMYFVTSLPAWVALTFVVVYCFVFRSEAEVLVKRYWLCLLLTEPGHKEGAARTAWGAAAAVYQSITFTALLLVVANVLLLAGLHFAGCARALVVWSHVYRGCCHRS